MGVSRRRGYRLQGKGHQGWNPVTGVPDEDNAKDIKEKLQSQEEAENSIIYWKPEEEATKNKMVNSTGQSRKRGQVSQELKSNL